MEKMKGLLKITNLYRVFVGLSTKIWCKNALLEINY